MAATDDIHDAIIIHAIDLDRVQVNNRNKILAFLMDLQSDLIAAIDKFDVTGTNSNTIKLRRLKALQKQTDATISSVYRDISASSVSDLRQIASLEASFGATALNAGIGADIASSVAMTAKQLDVLVTTAMIEGAPIREWWQGQSNGLKRRFLNEMRLGISRGEAIPQLMQRVRGTRARGFTDGIMSVSRREAAALVRSSVQVVSNDARIQTYEDNSDLLKGIQWVSTLDTRTSDICKALDGKAWTIDKKPIGHSFRFPGSTAHWQCRSTQVPLLHSWKEIAGKPVVQTGGRSAKFDAAFRRRMAEKGLSGDKIDKAVAGARASMDGQVSEALTFQTWLKKKETASPGFVADLLGPGKAKLFKAGKITTTDLIDQNLRPLTLEELRKLVESRHRK